MSKQLSLKFKKMLKQADFTHADLEYHKELLPEAKTTFGEAIAQIISEMAEEDQEAIKRADIKRQEEFEKKMDAKRDAENINPEEWEPMPTSKKEIPPEKESELKSIYRRIAAKTHPDKAIASGTSQEKKAQLEKTFIQAKKAYDEHNWYALYRIAVALDLPFGEPSQNKIDWIEEDIEAAMAEISRIAGTVAWVWYNGDDTAKLHALKSYFQQNYGLELVHTND